MIIELTGPTCCGKSTLYNNSYFLPHFQRVDNTYLDRVFSCTHLSRLFRDLYRETVLLALGLSVIPTNYLASYLRFHITCRFPLKRRMTSFYHIVRKYGVYTTLQNQTSTSFLVDEGISHIPYILCPSDISLKPSDYTYFPKGSHSTLILHLCASSSKIESRLKKRGHKILRYINISDLASRHSAMSSRYPY